MTDATHVGSGTPGSPIVGGPTIDPNNPSSGQLPETVSKEMYDSLHQKMGEMGNELGEYRTFIADIQPILDKLDENPDLIKAILEGKISSDLVKGILDGKVTVAEAATIEKAHETVKKDIGEKAYAAATPDQIARLVQDAVEKKMEEVSTKIDERDELRAFESKVNDFIANTTDFVDYADQVSAWLDDHPDILDVETAYYAVKGKISVEDAQKKAQEMQTEAAKEIALNAASGAGVATYVKRDSNIVDQLISGRSNPNVL